MRNENEEKKTPPYHDANESIEEEYQFRFGICNQCHALQKKANNKIKKSGNKKEKKKNLKILN